MEENLLRLILLGVGIAILLGIYLHGKESSAVAEVEPEELVRDRVFKGMPSMSGGASVETVIPEEIAEKEPEPLLVEEPVASPALVSEHDLGAESEEKFALDVSVEADEESLKSTDQESVVTKEEELEANFADSYFAQESGEPLIVGDSTVIQFAIVPTYGDKINGSELLDVCTELDLEFGDMGIFHRYQRQDGVETQIFHVANVVEPGTFPIGNMALFETKGVTLFMQVTQKLDAEKAFDEMLEVARQLSQHFDAELVDEKMQPLGVERIGVIRSQLAKLSI